MLAPIQKPTHRHHLCRCHCRFPYLAPPLVRQQQWRSQRWSRGVFPNLSRANDSMTTSRGRHSVDSERGDREKADEWDLN
ncbi:hypothetical protein Ancab_009431, partial [Ancistrocladus abbreviatus]